MLMKLHRIITPELLIENSPIDADKLSSHLVKTELWRGNTMPTDDAIASLCEGLREARDRDMKNGPHEAETGIQPIGRHCEIQRKRTKLLGWKTVALIDIYTE